MTSGERKGPPGWDWLGMVRNGRTALFLIAAVLVASFANGAAAQPPPAQLLNAPGFGSNSNSYAWAMQWFNGKLYVGTGRHILCVERAVQAFYFPTRNRYVEHPDPAVTCPPHPYDLDLRAEIWRYDPAAPAATAWTRIFQSDVVPNPFNPTKTMARDTSFRGMVVHTINGKAQLYVAGVSAREWIPGLPAPRILRMKDDETFEQVGGDPGAIQIGWDPKPVWLPTSFRSMASYRGKLFVTLAPSLTGDGVIMEYEPATDTLRQVSDPDLRVFELQVFNDFLYAGTGDDDFGYGVSKSQMTGAAPYYTFTPVVQNGAGRGRAITSVVSMQTFNGRLYVGSSGWNTSLFPASELIRLSPDDSWQVVVGNPRVTASGNKFPISGYPDGFANPFNAHFWRMLDHNSAVLALGTNDFSWSLRNVTWLDPFIKNEYGFDVFTTPNGWFWSLLTRNGFGQKFDFGARTFASSPAIGFIGTANQVEGTRIWGIVTGPEPGVPTDPEPPTATPTLTPTATATQPSLGPGGSNATPTATATSPSVDPSAPTPTATATATPIGDPPVSASQCVPRPDVQLTTIPQSSGGIYVTVTATTSRLLTANRIRLIRFRAGPGALVDIPGLTAGRTGSFDQQYSPTVQQTGFSVRQAVPGQAATVAIEVIDYCGEWGTFVGVGANGTGLPPGIPAQSPSQTGGPSTATPTQTPPATPTKPPANVSQGPLVPPRRVEVEAQNGANVVSWDVPAGATRFKIFRVEYVKNPALGSSVPNGFEPLPERKGVGIPQQFGAAGISPDAWLPGGTSQIGVSDTFYYQDRSAQSGAQYGYFVVGEDRNGTSSDPSNVVVFPTQAPPITTEVVQAAVADLANRGKLGREQADSLMRGIASARDAGQRSDMSAARSSVSTLRAQLTRSLLRVEDKLDAEDLEILLGKLERRMKLGEARVIAP